MGLIGSAAGAATGAGITAAAAAKANAWLKDNIEDYQAQREQVHQQQSGSMLHTLNEMSRRAGESADEQAAKTAAKEIMDDAVKQTGQTVTGGQTDAAKATMKGKAVEAIGQMENQQAVTAQNRRTAAWAQGQAEQSGWMDRDTQMLNYIASTRNQMGQNLMGAAQAAAQAALAAGEASPF